jgi:hypothetical protein
MLLHISYKMIVIPLLNIANVTHAFGLDFDMTGRE